MGAMLCENKAITFQYVLLWPAILESHVVVRHHTKKGIRKDFLLNVDTLLNIKSSR